MYNSGKYAIAWAEGFAKIDNKSAKLYPYQKKFLLDQSDYRIVLKARQLGFSLLIALEGLFEALTHRDYTVLYVSSSEDAAKRIIDYCYKFINSLEKKPKLKVASKTRIKFLNGSRLVSLPTNPDTIVGFKADKVYVDEFAHQREDKEVLEALEPSISRGGKLSLISTPVGRANLFWRIWEETQQGKSEYSPHKIKYTDCPDSKYRKSVKKMQKTMARMGFQQSFLCNPMSDELAFFPPEIIKPCLNPELKRKGALETENAKYMGWDFAKIDDSSFGFGVENVEGKAVVRYWKEIKPKQGKGYSEQLANIIYPSIDLFKPNKVLIDATSYGSRLFEELKDKYGEYRIEGIKFTTQKKEELIMNLRKMFEQEEIVIPDDEVLLRQLYSLEKSLTPTGKIRYKHAGTTNKDDAVWSLALAVYLFCGTTKKVEGKAGKRSIASSLNETIFERNSRTVIGL